MVDPGHFVSRCARSLRRFVLDRTGRGRRARLWRWALGIALLFGASHSSLASTCAQASSQGTAPADWATYCWLDFSTYNDALARSAGGQPFTFTLQDGSTLSFNVAVNSSAATALKAVTAPSWGGAAVGNTAFLGIPGRPVLYTATSGTVTVTFTGITLTPPAGVTGGSTYSFVAADGESTNQTESLAFTTNGGNWTVLDQVRPISGANYPTITNTGSVFTETGVSGTVGGYIVGSLNATQVQTVLVAGGLQGAMFALRYSTLSLNKALAAGRANAADQFTYSISATASGTTLASGTSSGAGNGPFSSTSSFITTPQSLTISEAMAPGSVSTLANYAPSITCTNANAGSATALPTNVAASSFVFPSIAFGDAITCLFTNTKLAPLLSVTKSAPVPALKVGATSVYTLTVGNAGNGAATSAQVKDQLPANLTFVSATGTNWTCSSAASLISCTFAGGAIASGGTSTIAVTVSTPVAAAGASDTNYASIDPTGGSSAPAPGPACAPAASCASSGPSTVIYVNPAADTGTSVAGIASTPIPNVAANDAVNGLAATLGAGGNATVATSGSWPAGLALTPATGAITTTAAVPPGVYSIGYQLCDRNAPANCATTTDTVTVTASIVPATASGSSSAGTASTPIADVAAGGTVNGAAATLGAGGNATVATSGSWPAGLALNPATGAITTTVALAPGTYPVAYQLCDRNAPPSCATATDTVTVNPSIVPAAASGTAMAGAPSTPIANVAANGTVNGATALLGPAGNATVATSGSWPAGLALNAANGAITTTAAAPPGTYSLAYQLCDRNTPVNCAVATDTVTVTASIVALPSTGTAAAGTAATPIANVAATDTVNGVPATLGVGGNATIATVGVWPAGVVLDAATGGVTTAPIVPPGSYALTYRLCDRNAPPNCATATDTVTLTAAIVPAITSGTAIAGTPSTPIANVAANGTVNGAAATIGAGGNATVAASGSWPAGFALNPATGAVTTTVAVAPGTYPLAYRLCDRNAPPDCATTTDLVTVQASILPATTAGSAVAGTPSVPIGNVAANGTVNGAPATLGATGNATVAESGAWPPGLTLNPSTGAATTTAALMPGSYAVAYQLCDRATPAHCATATDAVTVTASILAVPVAGSAPAGTPSTPIPNVSAADRVNGAAATLGPGGNATVATAGSWPAGLALDPATGAVTVAGTVPTGTYPVTYRLCDRNSPPDCATATVTVSVRPSIVVAALLGAAVSGTASSPIASATAGATINGSPAVLGAAGNATVAAAGAWPPGLALVPTTGAITTTAALAPGRYTVGVRLCDRATPPDCAAATDTVVVSATIKPATARGAATAGVVATPISNVAANGRVNGAIATLGPGGNATVAAVGTWPTGLTLNVATGAVTTSATLAPGTYPVAYQLCDTSTPPDCATATDTVIVAAVVIAAPASGSATAGTVATPIPDIVAPDTVNGAPATLGPGGNATIATSGAWPSGITLDAATGAVTTSPSVPPGTYPLAYRLCDRATPPHCVVGTAALTLTPGTGGALLVDKTASAQQAQVGDTVQYRLRVRNSGTVGVFNVRVKDALPLGFKLVPGTVRLGIEPAAPATAPDPLGSPGPSLTFSLGTIVPGEVLDLYYRVRIGVGAERGDGVNRAQALGAGATSPEATAQVRVTGGAFDTQACVVGKVFVDCNGNRVQDAGEPGIPGVRVYLEDGTNLTSDENGNFSLCGLRPITHVLKADPTTLPAGSRLVVLSSRNAGDGNSAFADLRDGELHRVDFAEGSCTNKVMEDVERRRHSSVLAPFPPAGREHVGVDFESTSGPEPKR